MSTDSVTGPVELAIIEFPGSHFKGEIVPKMADLVERGVVAILDLVFITKDNDGLVTAIELDNLDEEDAAPFLNLDGEVSGLLSDDDLQAAGAALSPGSSAAMIVWENTWPVTWSAPSVALAVAWLPMTAWTPRPYRKRSRRTPPAESATDGTG